MGRRWAAFKLWLAVLIVFLVVLSLILGISFDVKGIFFTAYGLVVIPRTILQLYFSIRNNFRNERLSRQFITALLREKGYRLPRMGKFMRYPGWRSSLFKLNPGLQAQWNSLVQQSMPRPRTIGVEVPVYGLTAQELEDTVLSIFNQSIHIDLVVIGLNQPNNRDLRVAAYRLQAKINDPRLQVVEMPRPGKRGAMDKGFDLIEKGAYEVTVNVDGDTVLDRDAIYTGLMLIDSEVGIEAVTSNVNVRNRHTSWLAELTFQRYRYANEQERAAQSWFKGVTCMSGPLMIMLTKNVSEIRPEWVEEKFMGVPIGPGDDRSLTMHHLRRGKGVAYSPASVVWTDCPTTIPKWKPQQLRWSRSGKREFVRGWSWLDQMPFWSICDQLYLMVFPFILGSILGAIAAEFFKNAFVYSPEVAIEHARDYVLAIIIINLINVTIAVIRNRDLRFFFSLVQLYMHVRYLVRIHVHALFTLPESAWLTRG